MSETLESDDFTYDCHDYGFKGREHNDKCMDDNCKSSRKSICFICNYLLAKEDHYGFEIPTNIKFKFFCGIIRITKCMFCNITSNCITIYDNSDRIGNQKK